MNNTPWEIYTRPRDTLADFSFTVTTSSQLAMSTESTVAPQIPYISPTSSLLDPDATFGQQGTRVCSTCKRVQLPTNQKWKRCPPCREKSREYRKRHLARVALATIQIPNENSPVTTGKRKEREDEEREDEDKADRLDRMKKKMRKHFADKPIGSSEHTSLPVTVSIRLIDPRDVY